MAIRNFNDIVVIGSNMVDQISKVMRFPSIGETIIGSEYHIGFGGKGANQAVMASRLGASVSMITKVGSDLFGPMTIENFKNQGIEVDYVFTAPNSSSGVAPIWVDENGRNKIIIVPGANMLLNSVDVLEAEELIKNSKIVISQLEIPNEAIEEGFRIAKAASVLTILNPAPARPVPQSIIDLTDIIIPNETEAELLTGIKVNGLDGVKEASQKLFEMGIKRIIITLGADGAFYYDQSGSTHFPSPAVNVIDTTGAGDAFIGSLAFAISKKAKLNDAVEFANICASLSVTKIGTQISFPTLDEVNKNLKISF